MRLTALDLSLTATGLFCGDPTDPTAPSGRCEIRTPSRRNGEPEADWNARRYAAFCRALLDRLNSDRTELLVIEVTSHAHQWHTRTRNGVTTRSATSRGEEFRAGAGLGHALGWIDGAMALASAYGVAPSRVRTIEAKDAKRSVAGAEGASKEAVKAYLGRVFGWDTDGWRESEVDALAVGLAYLRIEEQHERETRLLDAATDAATCYPGSAGRPGRRPGAAVRPPTGRGGAR